MNSITARASSCRSQLNFQFQSQGFWLALPLIFILAGLVPAGRGTTGEEISIKLSGTNVLIEWSAPGRLEYVKHIGDVWQELPFAESPFTVQPSSDSTFYRLRLVPVFEIGEAAYSFWPDGTVSLAIPIENATESSLGAVEVVAVDLAGNTNLALVPFPIALGEIRPEASAVVRARFPPVLADVRPYLFTARGHYTSGGKSHDFTVASPIVFTKPSNEPVSAQSPAPPKKWNSISAAAFYGPPKPGMEEVEFAQATPVPIGPDVALFPRSSPQTNVKDATTAAGEQFVRISRDSRTTGSPTGIPPDPNAAADSRGGGNSGVALITYNTAIGVSMDNGGTFTIFNPNAITDPGNPSRTTIFPEDDSGLCCDQLVTYVPQQNIFAWILQYWPQASGPNRIRVAWATPEAIRSDFINAWSWVDLTSGLLSIGNDWFDQPDVSFSSAFLYVSMSHGLAGSGQVYSARRMMARLSLADMVNSAAATVGISYYEPVRNGLAKTRIIQNSFDALRWATMDDTSSLYLYEWNDSSGSIPAPIRIGVTTLGTDYASTDPSGIQWLGNGDSLGGVRGSTYISPTGPRVYDLAVDSGRQTASGRPHPYVRIETITAGEGRTRTLTREFDVWNPSHGFALAELTHGQTGRGNPDLGFTISAGGGVLYPRYCVGFLGDFIAYYVADNNATESTYAVDSAGAILTDSAGNNIVGARYGDYSSVRLSGPAPRGNFLFSTLVYDVTTPSPGREACASGNCTTTPHYVEWGRPEDF